MAITSLRPSDWALITPSDTQVLNPVPGGLEVTTAGTIVMTGESGNDMTIVVEVGRYPYMPRRIKTGTTATVWGLY